MSPLQHFGPTRTSVGVRTLHLFVFLAENVSDLHHGPDQERRDEGEDDAGDQLEEEAVEQDVEAVQLHIGHLQHTIYSFKVTVAPFSDIVSC